MPRLGITFAVLALLALVGADFAAARVGSGSSFGSRGTRTYSAPPTTNTAPKTAAPIDKSMTNSTATAPTAAPSTGGFASRFGGLRGLLFGGLIAAGLASIFGFGALASVLGFALQMLLIAGVVWLVLAFIRSRRTGEPLFATAGRGGPMPARQAEPD